MKRHRSRVMVLPSQARIVLMAAVWLSIFAYAGRPLLAGAEAAGLAPAIAWSGILVAALLPILPFVMRGKIAVHWAGYTTMALFSTLLVLVVITDLVLGAYMLARWAMSAQSWPMLDSQTVSLTVLAAAAALSLVGLIQAHFPRVRNIAVPIDNLPPELEGYRIVQWSDVHVGPAIRRAFVQSLVERTNALQPDALAITGDLIDGAVDDLRNEVEPMRELRARDGVFYVTGNHEYYWRADEWIALLQSFGLDFLKNEHRVVTRNGARIVFAGITDPVGRATHKPDPDRALAGAPADAVKVLLSHRPQAVKDSDRLGVDLQLSGHTHGGQFFPFNLVMRKYFAPAISGLHRIGRTWLYVTRGTGYWGPPSRLAVGGEIAVVTLRRG